MSIPPTKSESPRSGWLPATAGLEVAEQLIKQGADVNARDAIWYQTPLSAAASGNHLELVQRLLDAGAEDLNEVAFQAATTDRHEVLRLATGYRKDRPGYAGWFPFRRGRQTDHHHDAS
jgi:hypothetical protein